MGTLHEDLFIFMTISRSVLLRIRNILSKIVEKIKTQILCSISFPPPPPLENHAVYDIMWKIIVEGASHKRQHCACAFHAGLLRLLTHSLTICNINFLYIYNLFYNASYKLQTLLCPRSEEISFNAAGFKLKSIHSS